MECDFCESSVLEVKRLREAVELAIVMITQLEAVAPGNELPGEYRMDGLDRLKKALREGE